MKYVSKLCLGLMIALCTISCNDDDANLLGSTVSINNTLQVQADPAMGGTGGQELPVELILNVPEGTFDMSQTVTDQVEFSSYLNGLYDIDVREEQITFDLVAEEDHPIYSSFFRTIEAGTFDRYYFSFSDDVDIQSVSSSDASVNARRISSTEMVIEVGEGFGFRPEATFVITIELN